MGRQAGSENNFVSTLTIKFNNVANDPFIEGSKLEGYGTKLKSAVIGVLGLNRLASTLETHYSKRNNQAVFTIGYKQKNGAAKAAILAHFLAGAEVSFDAPEVETTEVVKPKAAKVKAAKVVKVKAAKASDAPKRGPGRPKKGFTKNGKKLGRPVGTKNVAAATTEAPIAEQTQALAVDVEATLAYLRQVVESGLLNTQVAAPTAETTTETVQNATPVIA